MSGWNYICMYDETYVLDMSYICYEIVGFKKQKKRGNASSLPSAADGKGPFAVRFKKQTAEKLFTDPYFAGAFCRPRWTAKAFAIRHPCLCRLPWRMAK